MSDRLLRIYLNDHLAGAVGGLELCRRAARNNRGTPLGTYLDGLCREIEEDLHSLEAIMRDAGVARDPVKPWVAWGAEKVGRLKLNGSILGYSPLSRVVELEGLVLGVEGKAELWRALRHVGAARAAHLDRLIRRAERQRRDLEEHRLSAAELAFGRRSSGRSPGRS